jgi:hypothetical protein
LIFDSAPNQLKQAYLAKARIADDAEEEWVDEPLYPTPHDDD